VPTTGNYFHLHLVSDSTGETLITVARAVAAQYANVTAVEHVYPLVRSQKQLDRVLAEIEEAPGIVLFTLLEKDLVGRLEAKCRDINIPSLSIIGPVMQMFEAYLGAATTGRVGAQHVLNAEYFKRIDALNYTMLHDDGQHVDDMEQADVVLVGVSRTSKTPTSIYLANRGIRTANVPLVPGIPPPHQLETLKKPLVVSLHATPERLIQVRTVPLIPALDSVGFENEFGCASDCQCNYNGYCDSWETQTACPNDCQCNYNGVCESWENQFGCPNDCLCNYNGYCDPGETQSAAPSGGHAGSTTPLTRTCCA
jgi:regulator of PEP synthase PpsR (kinase-PPPase family)